MRTIEAERVRVERRHRAVTEIRQHLAGLYRSFVAWASLYGDVDGWDERERREQVVRLLDELSNGYLPRSVWLAEGTRKKLDNFLQRSGDLCSEFSADVEEQGYEKVRTSMAHRVSKNLGALRKDIESELESELAETRRAGWRERLRRS
ncbi:MAG: hypothetical protein ACRDTR_16685 [Rubrobacter sp.]